ncbi:MAG: ABC-F family ATP-binding cassette domain-containing protein [bacterium]|nr:ABC-F family ATP-binding cassette domain-containing protein [bacterium]
MNLVSVDSISKTQGDKTLFENISFGIDAGDRIGLVGVNGSGKSTLMNLVAGLDTVDGGRISNRKNLRIGLLRQLPPADMDHSIREHIFASDSPLIRLIHDYERACDALELSAANKSDTAEQQRAQDNLDKLSARMQDEDAYTYEAEIQSILRELGIVDLDRKMRELSGGMLKKVALAQILIDDADLLLLDEPTNHLDIDSILWLESYLAGTKKAVFMVTHDRYFLENITDRIFELDPPDIFQYRGNYGTYLEKRAEREEQAARSEAKARNFLRTEVEWLRRMPKARGTKQKARIDRIHEVQNRKQLQQDPAFSFSVSGRRLGNKILEAREIGKSFALPGGSDQKTRGSEKPTDADRQLLFQNFTYFFKPGERIGIVGPNGVGKSSFLNVLTGKLKPDSGEVIVGANTQFGYFDQTNMEMPADRRVLEFIRKEAGEILKLGDKKNVVEMPASKVLEYFRFDGRLQHSVIGKLSGGERRRLYLVFVLMRNPNFLILDEPTNDLDVQTLSLLEDFLQDYTGCLLVVSHDRYFMDRVVDQLFLFGPEAAANDPQNKTRIEVFPGSYADYLEYRDAQKAGASGQSNHESATDADKSKRVDSRAGSNKDPGAKPASKKKKRFSFKEKREFTDLEKEIESLENEKGELETQLAAGGGDFEQLAEQGERLNEVLSLIESKYERWNALADSVEELD